MYEFTYEKINFENIDTSSYYKRGSFEDNLREYTYVFYIGDVLIGICNRINEDDNSPRDWMPFTHKEIMRDENGRPCDEFRPRCDSVLVMTGEPVFNSRTADENGEQILPIEVLGDGREFHTHPAYNCYGSIGNARDTLEKYLLGRVISHADNEHDFEPETEMPDIF